MEQERLPIKLCRASHEHGHNGFKVDPKQMYPLLGSNPMVIINVCFSLMAVGDMLLILLLGTLLWSPRARVRRRNASLINLLMVTILATVPPALLCVSLRRLTMIAPNISQFLWAANPERMPSTWIVFYSSNPETRVRPNVCVFA